jgi:hypothetical protein
MLDDKPARRKQEIAHLVRKKPNYRFSTPCFLPAAAACELPDSDASKEGFRIPDSVARILKKGGVKNG